MTSQAPERAMSTVVSHVLSIAITTLLIISLVATATGFLEDQQQQAADQEIDMIGNRLAATLESADRLAQRGDAVRLRASLPDTVAGSTYAVDLLHDPSATSGDCGAFPETATCLRIAATSYDYTTIVPVSNQTKLSLTSGPGGQFLIDSDGGSGTTQLSRQRLDMSPRVGIGQSVGSGPQFAGGSRLSQTPIPGFTLTPGIPTTGTGVTFDASQSSDPDGSIATYEWDFDDDGSFEAVGVTRSHTFANAGTHNVTLRVTDNAGRSASTTEEIRVSGLEYVPGSLSTVTGNDEAITFRVRNRHSVHVDIERLLIDPGEDSLNELSEAGPGISCDPLGCWVDSEEDSGEPHEIDIDTPSDSGYVDWDAADRESLEIPDDGAIVDIDDPDADASGDDVDLAAGNEATITLQNFPASASGEAFTLGVRYRVNNTVSSTVITDST